MHSKTKKGRRRSALAISLLGVAVLVLFWIDLNSGYTPMSLRDFGTLLTGTASPGLQLSIVEFRLPRILMAMLVGAGLSASGCILQGVTRNELADPGVLGINAGAGLMVALMISLFSSTLQNISLGVPLMAFVGAVVTIIVVYVLSYEAPNGPSPARLVLTGIAIASAINAVTIMLLLRMRQDEYGFIASWLAGNIWGANWANLRLVGPWMAAFLCLSIARVNTLNILSLGPGMATGLGASLRRDSLLFLMLAAGMSGACVAVGGGISFVGLICPHMVRKLVGSRHQVLLPATVLAGTALMLLSDIIGRTIIAPSEIPIGVVATVIGTPYFLYLLVNRRR